MVVEGLAADRHPTRQYGENMNLLGTLKNVSKAVVNTALIPVDLAAELVSDPQKKSPTEKRIEDIAYNIREAYEDTQE